MEQKELPETSTPDTEIFELVYDGPDVKAGTMSAREFVEAVTGLNRAFSIAAQELELGGEYDLRVAGLRASSVHVLFQAVEFAKSSPAAASAITAMAAVGLNAVTNAVSGAYRIVTDIAKVIEAKKLAKGARIATIPAKFDDGSVELTLENERIRLTKEQYELLLSRRLDRPIAQVISPLSINHIETVEVRKGKDQLVRVELPERNYFDTTEITEDKSKEGTEISGTLNSLTKTSLRGTFHTNDGVHVPYRYTGGNIHQLLNGFASREPITIRGRVKYGTDGLPTYIEIKDIEAVQRRLPN
jgi:hypothetical protein